MFNTAAFVSLVAGVEIFLVPLIALTQPISIRSQIIRHSSFDSLPLLTYVESTSKVICSGGYGRYGLRH